MVQKANKLNIDLTSFYVSLLKKNKIFCVSFPCGISTNNVDKFKYNNQLKKLCHQAYIQKHINYYSQITQNGKSDSNILDGILPVLHDNGRYYSDLL